MFVKTHNGEVQTFPYSPAKLAQDNPNISFPKTPKEGVIPESTLDMLASFGVFPVQELPLPTYNIEVEKIKKKNYPTLLESGWVVEWEVLALSSIEIANELENTAINVRKERTKILENTDWMVIKSIESGVPVPTEWTAYRNSLREIPTLSGFPFNMAWPKAPRT
tara:strand:+ start:123 stop:617 length:495 start_codon:yes stop_codon:yes gene_type:complete